MTQHELQAVVFPKVQQLWPNIKIVVKDARGEWKVRADQQELFGVWYSALGPYTAQEVWDKIRKCHGEPNTRFGPPYKTIAQQLATERQSAQLVRGQREPQTCEELDADDREQRIRACRKAHSALTDGKSDEEVYQLMRNAEIKYYLETGLDTSVEQNIGRNEYYSGRREEIRQQQRQRAQQARSRRVERRTKFPVRSEESSAVPLFQESEVQARLPYAERDFDEDIPF